MWRFLLTYTLTCLSLCASAQNNHYFIDHARWVYQTTESYEPGQIFIYSGVEENTILGDTILEGMPYKKLYKRYIQYSTTKPPFPHQGTTTISYHKSGPTFLRYDAAENKVFYRENADNSEVVIYNFDLNVGDSIDLRTEYFNGNEVLRVDTISLFGNQHQLYVLDANYIPIRNGILEGVGGLNGLTYNQPAFGALGGGILMTDLVCFEFNDSTYLSPWTTHMQIPCPSGSDFLSSAKDINIGEILVFPNPNTGSFSIKIPEELLGASFFIYNEIGNIIYSSDISQTQLDVEIPLSGLYFWRMISTTGRSYTGKILVHRF